MDNSLKKYFGDAQFYRQMLAIALPITLQSLITVGVNMMDTIMLGRVGETALSASSLANQFINIYQICCMGIGMGASVLTSRFWGMQDIHSLRKTMTIMYRLCVGFGIAFTLATIFVPDWLIRIYSNEADVQAAGVLYFNWSIPTYLLLGLSLTSTIVLRSVGQVKLPLFCSIGAFFINIFFNWVFIFGMLGAPRMEVAGAALGTVIARVFEFSIICGYVFLRDQKIRYRFRHLLMKCRDLVRDYLRISIPVLISDSLLALGNNAVAMVMGRIGQTFVSANAITMVVQQLTSVMTQGISNASGIITGQTLGRGNMKKAQEDGYRFLFMGAVLGVVAAGLIMLISRPVISYYKVTEDTSLIAKELMLAISIIIVFQSMNSILTKGVLRGGGDTRFLMAGDILFLWVASVPLGALAGLVWHLPAFWIYFFLKIDQIIKCVWCVFRLRSGKWIKKIDGKK